MLKKDANIFTNMIVLLAPYKMQVLVTVLLSMSVALGNVVVPKLSQELIDNGLMNFDITIVIKLSLIIILINIIEQGLLFFQGNIYLKIQNQLRKNLSLKAFRHLCHLKMKYYEEKNSHEYLSSVNTSIGQISEIANESFLATLVQFIKLIGGLIGIIILSHKLTVIVIFAVCIRCILVKKFKNIRDNLFVTLLNENKEFSAWYSDILNGIKIIKLWNVNKEKEFLERTNGQIKNNINFEKTYLIENSVSEILEVMVTYGVYILSSVLICKGELTMGELFSFIMYSAMVIQPIFGLIQMSSKISQIKLAINEYIDFMSLNEKQFCSENDYSIKKVENITFNNVTLSQNSVDILTNITFSIYKNEKIAIIGSNGAGKSSLIDLLLRLKEQEKGEIYINGVNINNIKLNEYRELFSVFCQEGYIFNNSVKFNMLCENVKNKIDGLSYSEKMLFPKLINGWDTLTGQNGSLLSGGERQKINLFRCILKGGNVLILDEATANYDLESEELFNKYISNLESYDIIIIVTHKPQILRKMNRIILMEKGEIIAIGKYDELINNVLFQNYITEKE